MTDGQGDLFGDRIGEVREQYQHILMSTGGRCPVCDRWGKLYKRPLNATMVRALAWICKLSGQGSLWVDVPEEARIGKGTYDHTKQYSTLKYWGFLEHKVNDDKPLQKESGIWRPRPLAWRFLWGQEPVPLHVYTYNDELRRRGHEMIYVHDIIDGFNYPEIMKEL
jgi:hypothetical protein